MRGASAHPSGRGAAPGGATRSAAADYVALHPGPCLDVSNDFDVILWDVPTATIRRPDIALHNCAPDDVRPLPASYVRVIVEVVPPGSDKTDREEKMGEYASAGIPFYARSRQKMSSASLRCPSASRCRGVSSAHSSSNASMRGAPVVVESAMHR
jgi:Putative restriction endonuclease